MDSLASYIFQIAAHPALAIMRHCGVGGRFLRRDEFQVITLCSKPLEI